VVTKLIVLKYNNTMAGHYNENIIVDSDSDDDLLSQATTIESDDSSAEFEDDEHDYQDEHIFIEDADHFVERTTGTYYLGICQYIPSRDINLLANSVSQRVYFRNQHSDILRYLVNYSIIRITRPKIEIMKLDIRPDGSYSVILKTHWIRLIQRHWKKVYKGRQEIMKRRKTMVFQKIKELTGVYPPGYNKMPTIKGMLCQYFGKTN